VYHDDGSAQVTSESNVLYDVSGDGNFHGQSTYGGHLLRFNFIQTTGFNMEVDLGNLPQPPDDPIVIKHNVHILSNTDIPLSVVGQVGPRPSYRQAMGVPDSAYISPLNATGAIPTGTPPSAVQNFTATLVTQTVNYIGLNSTAGGTWSGVFGANGLWMAGYGTQQLPAYVSSLTLTGNSSFTYTNSTGDTRAIQKYDNLSDRVGAIWYSATTMTFNVTFNDNNPHSISVYCADYDSSGRSQSITIKNAATNATLDTRTVSAFAVNGKWLTWRVSGSVKVEVTNLVGGLNCAIAMIAFDAFGASGTNLSSSYVLLDWDAPATGTPIAYEVILARGAADGQDLVMRSLPVGTTSYTFIDFDPDDEDPLQFVVVARDASARLSPRVFSTAVMTGAEAPGAPTEFQK